MAVIVQKYGGSSVGDVERIRKVARKVKERRDAGAQLVVVVSAMGDTTDELLGLARKVAQDPPRRELDMLLTCGERISMALLSMGLQEIGVPAISFTGSQSGIITTDAHSQARIVEVRPFRIQDELEKGKVVIVAGYQGVSYKREVTTLGRGGSDTTAVALAAALDAEACEIYSDVDGIFSADPRVVPDARKLEALSYEEMQELASAGARVLNAQAVEFARHKGIVIMARSSFGGGTGTQVREVPPTAASRVKAVASEGELGVVSVREGGALLMALFEFLDARGVRGRLFAYDGTGAGEGTPGGFVAVPLQDVHAPERLGEELATRFEGKATLHLGYGTVTCVGAGLDSDWSVLRRVLAQAEGLGAKVLGVHTSPLQLSVLVEKGHLPELTRRLHADLV